MKSGRTTRFRRRLATGLRLTGAVLFLAGRRINRAVADGVAWLWRPRHMAIGVSVGLILAWSLTAGMLRGGLLTAGLFLVIVYRAATTPAVRLRYTTEPTPNSTTDGGRQQ